jgi:potassium-transporting ATPase KdpC subunit
MAAKSKARTTIGFLLGMTLLLGAAYPAAVTAVCALVFPAKAGGSLIVIDGAVRGSYLLAQDFRSPGYFRPRPSATDYAYVGAGASNLGPTSAALKSEVEERRRGWEAAFGSPAPEEMLYASASGLDPDIGVEAALAQAPAVAAARSLGPGGLASLESEIRREAGREARSLGPPRVNVVRLNVLLDSDPSFGGRKEDSYGE